MELICFEAGEGAYRVEASALRCGADLSVTVSGGTAPHVGASALAQFEPERGSATVSVLTAFTHRDNVIAERFAKALAKAVKGNVSVSAGLHTDGASEAEIGHLCANAEECLRQLLLKLEET